MIKYIINCYVAQNVMFKKCSKKYQPFDATRAQARYVTFCLRHRVTYRVTSELIFWYVTLEAMWYMYIVDLSVIYVDLSDHYVDLSETYHHN